MRAAAFTGLGGPENVEVIDIDEPTIGNEEVLLDVKGASINRHDLIYLRGNFRLKEEHLPFVSGVDVAGEVLEVGDDVTSVSEGDRVVQSPMRTCGDCVYCREGPENLCESYHLFHGGFAERAAVEADRLVPVSGDVDLPAAAALPVAYMTAWHMIRRADVTAGDTVLVPGATGGVGIAALQLLDTLGATAIGTSSSTAKLDRLSEFGADHSVQVTAATELNNAVEDLGPIDAVLNHLSGDFTEEGVSVLRRGGRMVICGQTASPESSFEPRDLFLEHKRIIGSTMGTQSDLERALDLVEAGQFSPPIYETYSLDETDQAFATMQDRDFIGKLVVTP